MICPSRSCAGIAAVCLLLVQCLFWSWAHRTTSIVSVLSVWGERQRRKELADVCVFRQFEEICLHFLLNRSVVLIFFSRS